MGEFGLRSIFFVVAIGAATCAAGYSFLPELRGARTAGDQEVSSFQELLKAPEQQAGTRLSGDWNSTDLLNLYDCLGHRAHFPDRPELGEVT